ncbi:hypothetical protein BDZ94DRAFT_1231150 [Collybia nuda]|uniref:Uncharacterized protein n=1 Tax=Collybia nuda TaxID=64659 RepID=A0A9P6CKE3_9AGAR|nr:hypothetical protein BDZ94DRAFT_1231150 [Collybia nuda]
MFITCAVTFAVATANEATNLAGCVILVDAGLIKYPNLTIEEKVVWRAFVLFQNRRWLIVIPSFLLLGSVGGLGLSLGANVVATALIGYKYWTHRKMVTGLRRNRKTQSEQVLALLVESGIVFCIPQAATYILQFVTSSGLAERYLILLVQVLYFGLSTMYPILVIALVNNQRTFDHTYLMNDSLPAISDEALPGQVNTIRFAQPDIIISPRTIKWEVGDDPSISVILDVGEPHQMENIGCMICGYIPVSYTPPVLMDSTRFQLE